MQNHPSDLSKPVAITERLNGFVPTIECFDLYRQLFHDPEFILCYGIHLNDTQIKAILKRDIGYWSQFKFGPYAWFDKHSNAFVGEGGLNHTQANGKNEIELTYSLLPTFWSKGLAVEIGRFAIRQAFEELHLKNIVCFTMTTNHQSLRVIEKLGFQYERDFMHYHLPHKLYRMSCSVKKGKM
jgi:[ribosomal protein S5]-alanine N-acetyltransferase